MCEVYNELLLEIY